ncbi:MAG: RAD55 family ATPase [Methanocellales archaeon]|nr:RAD55 family ATPase [Methanocellales archaeon]
MSKYKLGIAELDKILGGIGSGTNIMLIGPPMCGKDIFVNNIVHAGLMKGEGIILVSTREHGEGVLKWFEQSELDIEKDRERFGIVDCVSRTLGMDVSDTQNIKRASSPMDLTGIGIRIGQFFENFWMKVGIRKIRLVINSLSTMLMYSNLPTVFRFLHVFTGRIKVADAIGIYVIESGMHDEQTIATLKQLFDGVIEIKEEEGRFFIRARGLGSKPTKWVEVEGANIATKHGVSHVIS